MRHKHADVIHAWAEGEKIQYRDPANFGSSWIDYNIPPGWWEEKEYRIKPKTQIIKYRNYINLQGKIGVAVQGTPIPEERNIAWLSDDWLEVEVEKL